MFSRRNCLYHHYYTLDDGLFGNLEYEGTQPLTNNVEADFQNHSDDAWRLKHRQQVLVRCRAAKATFSTDVKGSRQQGCVCKGQTATRDTITFTSPFGHIPYLSLSTTWRGLQSVPKHSAQQGHSLSISCYKRTSFTFIKFSFSSVFLLVSFSS